MGGSLVNFISFFPVSSQKNQKFQHWSRGKNWGSLSPYMRSVVHLVLYPASASGQCHRQGFLQQRIQMAQHNKSQAADGIVFWRRLSESTWKFCLSKEWVRLRKVSCAQPKSGLYLSGRAGRELSVHGGQEQGTEGWSRRVSSSLKSWKYAVTFFSKISGCSFIMHTLCACTLASRTDPTDHNDTKGAVTVPPVNQVWTEEVVCDTQ